jgi:hypothetical protein
MRNSCVSALDAIVTPIPEADGASFCRVTVDCRKLKNMNSHKFRIQEVVVVTAESVATYSMISVFLSSTDLWRWSK